VIEASTNPNGCVFLSVHLPLTNLMLCALEELNHPPTVVVLHPSGFRGGRTPLWGKGRDLPGLAANRSVLLKARRILSHGGSLAALIDTGLDSPLNGNALRLSGLVGARVVFAITALQTNGEILVQFYTPPDPFCGSEEGVALNLEFLQEKLDNLLGAQISERLRAQPIALRRAKSQLAEIDSNQ
jgi:hypothetical protein